MSARLEDAREVLRRILLDSFRHGSAEVVVEAVEMLIEAKIEQMLGPCVYEARELPSTMVRAFGTDLNPRPTGAWCQTHGWQCPNRRVVP